MREVTVKVYKYNELSDKGKERARYLWAEGKNFQFDWQVESRASVLAFCNHFGVGVVSVDVDPYSTSSITLKSNEDNFKNLKLEDFDRNHMPTGCVLDCNLWQTFYGCFKETGNAEGAFTKALDAGLRAWQEDLIHQASEEYVQESMDANDYEFYENGEIFKC